MTFLWSDGSLSFVHLYICLLWVLENFVVCLLGAELNHYVPVKDTV